MINLEIIQMLLRIFSNGGMETGSKLCFIEEITPTIPQWEDGY